MVTDAALALSSRRLIPFYGRLILNSLHTLSQMLPTDCLLGDWSHSVEGSYWTACICGHRFLSLRLSSRGLIPFYWRLVLNSLHTWSQMLPTDCLLGNWSHSMEGSYWTACIHGHRCCLQIVFLETDPILWKAHTEQLAYVVTDAAFRLSSWRLIPFCRRLILNSLHTLSQMLPSDCLLGDWSHSVEGSYWTACICGHRCCLQIVFLETDPIL